MGMGNVYHFCVVNQHFDELFWKTRFFYSLVFQQLIFKLIDNFTRVSAPSPCIKISLVGAVNFLVLQSISFFPQNNFQSNFRVIKNVEDNFQGKSSKKFTERTRQVWNLLQGLRKNWFLHLGWLSTAISSF